MREIDFHGMTVQEALHQLELLVGEIRMEEDPEDVRLITGQGKIMNLFLEYLEREELDHHLEWGNNGCIIATIE
jgi:hypothetical protein